LKRLFGRLVLFILLSFPVTLTPGYHQPFAYGQASTAALQESQPLPNLDEVKNLIRVPLIRQTRDYTCGVAALQSVLLYYGEEFPSRHGAGPGSPSHDFRVVRRMD
jgi:hypothetical protein